jgi:DNA-binding PadR family transcriptional regulator
VVAAARLSNPLALAVLVLLFERPMHPYEMSTTLRERRKEQSIKLNYGSLYSVVAALDKHGLIEVQQTVREGNRPERTVYRLTAAGEAKAHDWLASLISERAKEYSQFEAALSLIGAIEPDEALRLLELRLQSLQIQQRTDDAVRAGTPEGFPQVFMVEGDYHRSLLDAETAYVRRLIDDIRHERLTGLKQWRLLHELRAAGVPAEEIMTRIGAEFGFPTEQIGEAGTTST